MDTKKCLLDYKKVVVLDDVINKPGAMQNKIANRYTDGRQQSINQIYISQSYNDVPSKLRQICSHLIFYHPLLKNWLGCYCFLLDIALGV